MIEDTELIYREEQRFTLWLHLLIALSMVWISQKNYMINTFLLTGYLIRYK